MSPKSSPLVPRALALGGIAIVAALAVSVGQLVFDRAIATNPPVSWDEGAHSLFGVLVAQDMRQGNLLGLAYDTYRQVYWPPMHSWLVAVAFLGFGETIAVSRSVSLAAYELLPLALMLAARVMYPAGEARRGWTAATIAGLLAVAMPALVPFASLAFLDLPALLALSLTLLAAFFGERARQRPQRQMLVALGILATYLLKTNYGLLLMLVFGIDRLMDVRSSREGLRSRRTAYLVIPIAIVLAIWFAYPPKIAVTLRAMVNKPAGADPWSFDGLLFYPRVLLAFAGSVPMLCVLIAGLAAAWRSRRAPNVRLLLILAVLQFAIGQLHHTKEDRHLLPIVPPLVLLASSAAERVWHAVAGVRLGRVPIAPTIGALFAALLAWQVSALVTKPLPVSSVIRHPLAAAQAELASSIEAAGARGGRTLVVGTFDLSPGPPAIDWDLVVSRRLLDVERSGAIAIADRDRALGRAIRGRALPAWIETRLGRTLGRFDALAPVKTLYAGLPERLDSVAFARSVGAAIAAGEITTLIVMTSAADTARYRPTYFEPVRRTPSLVQVSSRVIDGATPVRLEEYRVGTGPTR
jgi:hypothetical protein